MPGVRRRLNTYPSQRMLVVSKAVLLTPGTQAFSIGVLSWTRIERDKIRAGLSQQTAALPDDAFFLEHSRMRELAYIERSAGRWLEILELAFARLRDPRGLSCLDVGVSPFTFLLKQHFGTVTGLDLTASFRERCDAQGIRLFEGGVTSAATIALLPKFDCVFCLEVLEHLHANPVEVLRNLHSALKPGGRLVLTTPNMMCLANRVGMIFNSKLRHFSYPPFAQSDKAHGFAHDRIYMPAELCDYFVEADFTGVETLYQLHFSDSDQPRRSLPARCGSFFAGALKAVLPSMRDGVVLIGARAEP